MYKSRKKSDVLFAGIFVILAMWMILSVHCRAAEKNNDEKQSQIVRIGSFEDTFDYIDKNGVRRGYGYRACFSASGISKKWFYCIGRKPAALCFLLFVGHTGRFLHKGSDLRRCRRPCNIETATNLIKRAIKRLSFRVALKILFCFHRKHLTSNMSQRYSSPPRRTVHNAALRQNSAVGTRHNPEHSVLPTPEPLLQM